MMIIDLPLPTPILRQFSNEAKMIPSELKLQFEGTWNGDQSDEFYRGLIAGLGVATSLLQDKALIFLPPVTAFVADRMEKKEIIAKPDPDNPRT